MVQENSDLNVLKGKKLLVLGGAFQHCKVVEAAHELGIIVYVTDYLDNSPAKKLADVALDIDVKDVDSIVNYCKKNNIEGVINTSLDPCQIPYQEICERLNLPCYGTRKQFEILTNKKIFKEYCKKYGVDTIQEFTEEDIKNNNIEFPVLVKPEISRGSRGQSVCYNKPDLRQAINYAQKESVDGNVIIEKYMNGYHDFTVAYLFINGEGYVVRTGDRYVGLTSESLDRVAVAALSPSKYTDLYFKHVNDKVINMLKNIGIKNGPVFFQGFIDQNTVRFYDPGFRFGGSEYERVIKEILGINIIEILIRFALTGNINNIMLPSDIYLLKGKKAVQLLPALNYGLIQDIIGTENFFIDNVLISFFQRYEKGDKIPNSNDVRRRFGEIFLVFSEKSQLKIVLNKIKEEFRINDNLNVDLITQSFRRAIDKLVK